MTLLPHQPELLKQFSGFLAEAKLSSVSIKNYLSDLRHFFAYISTLFREDTLPTVKEVFQNLPKYIDRYQEYQKSSFTPPNTSNRRLASIRRFSTFLESKHGLTATVFNGNYHTNNSAPNTDKILSQFKDYLYKEKKTHSTIKNYLSDLNHFMAWSAKEAGLLSLSLPTILSENTVSAYITYLKLSHTTSSVINRRQSSIRQFAKFCFIQGVIPSNPFAIEPQIIKLAPLSWLDRLSNRKSSQSITSNRFSLLYKKYHSLPFTPYLHLALLVLATSAMVLFGYNQIIKDAPSSRAALPTVPKRQLSFQGRLTDTQGTPITTSVNVNFKLFNDPTTGTELYTSNTCSISPDSNGIFNTLIGNGTCGQEISSTVFSENRDVYLQVAVGSETLTPRQQIATVGYALNSETLQGYPASAAATINTIPLVDQNGDINLAVSSPSINSTSGTFTLSGQALTLQTASNSGGDIILQPDAIGGGQVQVLGSTTSTDTLRVENANLTSGALISGYVGNNTSNGRLLSLTSGVTETDRFYVGADGQTAINTRNTLDNSALLINQNGNGDLFSASASGTPKFTITNSGNILASGTLTGLTGLTVASGTVSLPSGEINNAEISELDWTKLQNYPSTCPAGQAIQAVGDTLTCVDIATYSGNLWQLNSGAVTPLNITNSLNLGATATSSATVHLAGTSGENSFINTGNFGIGTNNPTSFTHIYKDQNAQTELKIENPNTGSSAYSIVQMKAENAYTNFFAASNAVSGIWQNSSGMSAGLGNSLVVNTETAIPIVFGINNSEKMRLSSSGDLGIGTTSPGAKLETRTASTATTGFIYNNKNILTLNPSGGTSSLRGYGSQNTVVQSTGNSNNVDVLMGLSNHVEHSGSGTVTSQIGFEGNVLSKITSGTAYTTTAKGASIYSEKYNGGTWSVNNLKTLSLETPYVYGGTLTGTNIYGLYLDDFSLASGTWTNKYAIYSSGGTNYFGGRVGIGNASPGYELDITGDINLTGGIRANSSFGNSGQILSSTGTGVSWIDAPTGSGAQYWQRNGGVLTPTDTNDSITLGNTATSSATVHLAGKTGVDSFINTGNFGVGDTTPASLFTVGNGDLFQINSSGAITAVAGITNTGALTTSGGITNINASSNYATNINTGTSTGAVSIGGGSNTVAVNSSTWDIASTGAVSGITTINMSGQLTSTVATGSAPFNVTSTTMNPNLNADLLDGQHASYFAPAANISGSVNRIAKFTAAGAVGNSSIDDLYNAVALTIDASGNFGIGDTTPASLFTVGNGDLFQINSSGAITAVAGITNTGALTTSGGDTNINASSNYATNINTGTSTGAVSIGGGSNTVAISTTSWGITSLGVASGLTGLSSSGNIDFASLAAGGLVKAAATTGRLSIASAGTDYEVPLTFSNGLTRSSNEIKLGGTLTANTEIPLAGYNLAFSGTGNIGIGVTNPSARLEIAGASSTITNSSGDISLDAFSNQINFSGDSLVNFLNATASGQIKLGSFETALLPTSIGAGSLIYNSTEGLPQYYDGSTWKNIGSGTSGGGYFNRTADGVLYPSANWSDSINLFASSGDGATSSAKIRLSGDTVSNTFFLNPVAIGFSSAMTSTTMLQVGGDILPQTNNNYNLGRSSYSWASLFLGDGIYNATGTQQISISNRRLAGGSWNASSGMRIGDTTALPGGYALWVTGNASVSGTFDTGGQLTVGGGAGKIDVGTVDPPYTINGKKYATYMASMIGVKEETVGKISTENGTYIKGLGYRTLIDLDQQPEGSDLWLFSKTTALASNIAELQVLLTAEGQAKTWYEVDQTNKILAIYSSTPTNVTYRLTAPRFDAPKWKNTRTSPSVGHVITDLNSYQNINSIFDIPAVDPQIIANLDGTYALNLNGQQSQETGSFFEALVANFKAGSAVVASLIADNLTVRTKLISPIVETDSLLAKNATISGTLDVAKINNPQLDTLNSEIALLANQYATASSILAVLQSRYASYDSLLSNGSTSTPPVTDPLILSPLATTSASFISLDTDILTARDILAQNNIFTNSLSSYNSDLFIEPLAERPVHLMANLMTLYPNGKILVNGDLILNGALIAASVDTRTATISGTLAIGPNMIASDSANFNQIITEGLVIASSSQASPSSLTPASSSNASIGQASISSFTNEVFIPATRTTPNTLIYVTPTSDTKGQVLFVKSKEPGVGFTVALSGTNNLEDITFNYWLVETK